MSRPITKLEGARRQLDCAVRLFCQTMGQAAWASDGCGLCPAELCSCGEAYQFDWSHEVVPQQNMDAAWAVSLSVHPPS
jgi:hypothetical protein